MGLLMVGRVAQEAIRAPAPLNGKGGPEPALQRGAYCPEGLSLLLAPVGTANHSLSRQHTVCYPARQSHGYSALRRRQCCDWDWIWARTASAGRSTGSMPTGNRSSWSTAGC